MQKFLKRLIWQNKESTAQSTLRELLNKGVRQENITSKHIMHVYSSSKKILSAPDFAPINGILLNQSNTTIDETSPIWGIIVETRKHPAIDFVVNNFINNTQIPVQIFHGKNNLDFIMSTTISELVHSGKVHLTQLDIDELSANKYNALFLSKRFWRNVLSRKKILVFQTDTISCSSSDYSINDFLQYDYIGSKWPRQRPVGLIIDGGNGGLSLRDWEKTYDCLSRFPAKNWGGGEDGYFAFHIDLIGGKVGKVNDCAKFSTQSEFLYKSWGGHQISCLNSKNQAAFISYCKEAKFMSSYVGK